MKTVLVTGSSGLIGSEAVAYFDRRGWRVVGVDNNMRADFFGPKGDTTWNLSRLRGETKNFNHVQGDIRDRAAMKKLIEDTRPDLIVHAAAQPSHDLAAKRPFDDFDVNAVGTLNLLESTRQARDGALCDPVFIFMSTNKVYGDVPNELPMKELPTRWEYAREEDYQGGGGRDDAGVREILRPEDRHVPRRLPDGAEPLGRRAARVLELPVQGGQRGGQVHDLRVQGQAGAG
jgi:CDP-paratose 2-epimerase